MLAKKIFAFLIPVPQTSLILLASCRMRGRFLEAILSADRARAGRTGARPGTVDRLVAKVERREALRPTSLGARGWRYQLREARRASSQGCPLVPWRLPPLHPLARFARDLCKPRTHCAARSRKLGCLKLWIGIRNEAPLNLAPLFCGERSTRIVRCAAGEGPGTAPANEKLIGSKGLRLKKHDPKVRRLY